MHPNLEVAQRGYRAFADGDVAGISATMADDVVWHAETGHLSGDYEGRDAVLGYLGQIMAETGGTFSNEIHDMLANDDHVTVLTRMTGERNGKHLDMAAVHVLHVADGQMKEFWSFNADRAAVEDFWS